jgi:hypothetical protein
MSDESRRDTDEWGDADAPAALPGDPAPAALPGDPGVLWADDAEAAEDESDVEAHPADAPDASDDPHRE